MLTQSQKEKLHPFTLHSKFGKLLIEAMNVWETAIPYQGGYGITQYAFIKCIAKELTHYQFEDDYKECCMIGASLVNKSTSNCTMEGSINEYFDLQHDETRALIHGFDEELNSLYNDSEGYIFANQVAKIIFHESE